MQHIVLKCCNTSLLSRGFSKQRLFPTFTKKPEYTYPTFKWSRTTQFTPLIQPQYNIRHFRMPNMKQKRDPDPTDKDAIRENEDHPEDIEVEDKFGPIWLNTDEDNSEIWDKRIIMEYDPFDENYFVKFYEKIESEAVRPNTIRQWYPKYPTYETDTVVPHHMRAKLVQRHFNDLGKKMADEQYGPEQDRPSMDDWHKTWLSGPDAILAYRFKPRSFHRWRKNWILRNSGIFDDDVVDFRISNTKEYQNISRPKMRWLENAFVMRGVARVFITVGVFAAIFLFLSKIYDWITDMVEGAAIDAMVLLYEVYKVSMEPIANDPIVQRVLGKGIQGDEGSVRTKFYKKQRECLLLFPIYGPRGKAFATVEAERLENGIYKITKCDVDLCNGHIHAVPLDEETSVIDLNYLMWKMTKEFEEKEAEKKDKAIGKL